MAEINIRVDLSDLLNSVDDIVTRDVMPSVSHAINVLGIQAQRSWREAIFNAPLRDGEKMPYMESVKMTMVGSYRAEVTTDYKYAGEIEDGRPARDLKAMLETSKKVRYVQKGKNAGKRYLIIPFRHNTSGNDALAKSMPLHINAQALQLKKSIVTGSTMQSNGGKGARIRMVKRATYKWGDKLPAGLAPKLKDFHTTDIYAGMVRMKTSAGKSNSSAYLTFRVMMEGSPKWIVGAKPGLKIVDKIGKEIDSIAPALIAQAFKSLA